MFDEFFITDIAIEAAQRAEIGDIARKTKLSYGIEQLFLNVDTIELSKRINRERGVYVTLDCGPDVYVSSKACFALEKYVSNVIVKLAGNIKRSSPVFVAGLGNNEITADALGGYTVGKIKVSRGNDSVTQEVCALSAGVYGATGIQSVEVISALTKTINPSLVILVDSFATSSVNRLGASYQISTAGLAPASGVGQDKPRIDRSVLGVPVISIGVPLVLSMRTLICNFASSYAEKLGCENDQFKLRQYLSDSKLSGLIVAPKDIKYMVEICSDIISGAINRTFS